MDFLNKITLTGLTGQYSDCKQIDVFYGRYLGEGSRGTIYEAFVNEGRYALKNTSVLELDLVRHMLNVSSSNVASLMFTGFDEVGQYYIASQVASGFTLERALLSTTFSEEDIRTIALGILDGVESFHLEGLVYGDLKVDNVMIEDCNKLKIIDIDSANFNGVPGHRTRFTPSKSPLKRAAGAPLLPADDIFALGMTIAEIAFKKGVDLLLKQYGAEQVLLQLKYRLPTLAPVITAALQEDETLRPSVQDLRGVLSGKNVYNTIHSLYERASALAKR